MADREQQEPKLERARYPEKSPSEMPQPKRPRYPEKSPSEMPQPKRPRYPEENAPGMPRVERTRYQEENATGKPQSERVRYPDENVPEMSQPKRGWYPGENAPVIPKRERARHLEENAPEMPQPKRNRYQEENVPEIPREEQAGYLEEGAPEIPQPKRGRYQVENVPEISRAERARYAEESTPEMYPRTAGDQTAYPDQVYQQQAVQRPMPPNQASSSWAAMRPRPAPSKLPWLAAAVLSFLLLCGLGYFISSLHQPYDYFRQKVNVLNRSTFAQGITVDRVAIGGMTRAQAEKALQYSAAQQDQSLWVVLQVDGTGFVLTPNELPLERNIQAVLDTAYAIGRQGSRETIGTSITPFEYRYAHVYHTNSSPVALYTTVTYDPEKLWAFVRAVEGKVNRAAVDAKVATFDFASRTFTFAQEIQGARLNAEKVYRLLADALDRRDYTAVLSASTEPVLPAVTKVELMNAFKLIASFSTQTTANSSRNNNIRLAAQAINGAVVMPGETFSFNQATGQRTEAKGYLPAPAILDGATVDEVGGGVCQVSSTLFNAAALANLTIVERSPHTWPSNYVHPGRDATVNWPNLDFRFRNDQSTPVFIVASFQDETCAVEIYGAAPEPGLSIDLATAVAEVISPPAEPAYEYNPLLPPGTIQEKKKARTGYVVNTFRIYRQNGKEIRRELLCTSNYPMIQQVLEYN